MTPVDQDPIVRCRAARAGPASSRSRAVFTRALALLGLAGCGADSPVPAPGAAATTAVSAADSALATFYRPPTFDEYPTGKVDGIVTPAPVDLSSHPEAPRFRTVLNRGAAEGPNFAGRFTIVAWGCGTMCQRMMLVDAATGRVVAGLDASLGFAFRLGSRLLVVDPPEALRESPCPTCETRYFVLDGDRQLRELAPESWMGDAPPPPAARALVSRVRAEEDGSGLRELAPAVVRATWSRLEIVAGDGSRHVFADEVGAGDLRSIHRFVGRLEGVDAYVVERRYVPEGGEYLLVEARSGRVTRIDAPAVPSPDGSRFVTASLDLVAGHSPNRLRVYRMEAGGPAVEWEVEPREWGARAPVWQDESTVRLERAVVDWKTHTLFASPMTLRRQRSGWSLQASPAQARDALLSYFSALGQGHFVEAVQLYGGSYEVLRGWNPDTDPGDLPTLWRAACERNGLQCMGRAEVVRVAPVSPSDTRFTVRFFTESDEPFVLGPCCGATEEEMPPRGEFEFTVRRVGDRYLVQDLPVYVP